MELDPANKGRVTMDAAIVALIERVERDLQTRIAEVDMRLSDLEYDTTIGGLREEITFLRDELAAIRSAAAEVVEEAAEAVEEIEEATEEVEEAAEEVEEAAEEVEEETSEESEPELIEPADDEKTPDRRSWYEKPILGGN